MCAYVDHSVCVYLLNNEYRCNSKRPRGLDTQRDQQVPQLCNCFDHYSRLFIGHLLYIPLSMANTHAFHSCAGFLAGNHKNTWFFISSSFLTSNGLFPCDPAQLWNFSSEVENNSFINSQEKFAPFVCLTIELLV